MDELLEVLESTTNVESIYYDVEKKKWTIGYKSDLVPTSVDSGELINFLQQE